MILVPVYKSYADPVMLHYIHHLQDMELGFTFGNYEDSPKIHLIDRFLKTTGTFLIRRGPQNSLSKKTVSSINPEVMNYVYQSLLEEVVSANPITTLFQNDERIRSGKYSYPLYPDNSIRLLLKAYQRLRKYKYNIHLVPVCMNYDRLFDASYLANEMVSGKFE